MAALQQYSYVFAITTVFAALDAWNIGANDVANSFATSVSSRSLTLKQALALAVVCEFSGSVTVGSRVTDTVRSKIVHLHHFDTAPAVLLLAMMCTIVGSSVFLTIATRCGMPVSTTHSLIGGLIGAVTASIGIHKVNWGWTGVSRVVAGWVIAPCLAGCIGAVLFLFTRVTVLSRPTAVRRAFYSIPFYTFLTVGALTMLVVWQGIHTVELPTNVILVSIFSAATGGAIIQVFFIMPYLWVRIMREDWSLQWYHALQGPFLLKRSLPPPGPCGLVKPQVDDYYRDHLTPEELKYVRASEKLLQSVQTRDGKPPCTNSDEEPMLPILARASTLVTQARCRKSRCRRGSDANPLVPPRPAGPWNSLSVMCWKMNRFFLKGLEKDVVGMQKRHAVLQWDIEDMHSRAPRYDKRAEHMYCALQVLTAAAASFTHGANDVSNAIAPFSIAYDLWSRGRVMEMVEMPIWVLFFGGGVIVLGLLTYGYHVMRTLGNRLTLISPSRGFCMELASAMTVMVATRMQLPVSTTQCITGATVGVGLANGDWKCINPKLVSWIYAGWIITLPATGLLSGCLMALMLNAPSLPST